MDRPLAKLDWLPIAICLLPALPLILLTAIPSRIQPQTVMFASRNWGSIASVWGLGVSIYLISIARGARKAAQEAKVGEKARTALQELRQAAEKNIHIGQFARTFKWDALEIRAEEVMNCCYETVARWKDDPQFKQSCDDLLMVAVQMRSIIVEAGKKRVDAPNIVDSQLLCGEKLNTVIGRIQREQDSRSE
jgi:hypothetical protein